MLTSVPARHLSYSSLTIFISFYLYKLINRVHTEIAKKKKAKARKRSEAFSSLAK